MAETKLSSTANPRKRTRKGGKAQRFFQEVVLPYDGDECLPWPYTKIRQGYGLLWDGTRSQLVTRLVCAATHGPAPSSKHEAAHSCGKGHLGCCAKRHLSWKTPLENQQDKIIHGTVQRGENSSFAKLTEADVRRIRALRGHVQQCEIAKMYGVAKSTICMIHSGKNWGWLV